MAMDLLHKAKRSASGAGLLALAFGLAGAARAQEPPVPQLPFPEPHVVREAGPHRATVALNVPFSASAAQARSDAPQRATFVDERGVRAGRLLAVRKSCVACGDERVCDWVADYAVEGTRLAPPAIAVQGTDVQARRIEVRAVVAQADKTRHVATVFASGYSSVELEADGLGRSRGWVRTPDAADWLLQERATTTANPLDMPGWWRESPPATFASASAVKRYVRDDGRLLSACDLYVSGPWTEAVCGPPANRWRMLWHEHRYVSAIEDGAGRVARFDVTLDGETFSLVFQAQAADRWPVLLVRSGAHWRLVRPRGALDLSCA